MIDEIENKNKWIVYLSCYLIHAIVLAASNINIFFIKQKILNTNNDGSRTNLSISNDTLSSISHEDTISSLFTLEPSQNEPRSADTLNLESHTPLCVAEIYRENFFEYVSLLKKDNFCI